MEGAYHDDWGTRTSPAAVHTHCSLPLRWKQQQHAQQRARPALFHRPNDLSLDAMTHTSSDDRSFAGVAPDPNLPPASIHTEAARGNLGAVQQLVESESPARRKVPR